MVEKPIRCILLSEMLQPYRIPLFNLLAERDDLEFKVLPLSTKEANRQWEVDLEAVRFDYEVLPSKDFYIRPLDWGLHLNRGVIQALEQFKPDVICGTGYVSPAYITAQRYAREQGCGYVLWTGSTEKSSRIGKGPLRWLKRRFVGRSDSALAYGSAAKKLLVNLGANPERIVAGYNTVDIDVAARITEEASIESNYLSWREKYPKRNILFIGQIIARKGLDSLIRAFARAAQPDLGLIIVGDGALRNSIESQYENVPNLFWEGYVQSHDMGRYFAASDVLAMPSEIEVWGLVVNEAMAAGLPVIATTCSGAAEDLIVNGDNGYAYESGDEDRLADLLKSVATERELWMEMGKNAQRFIQGFGLVFYADSFVQAVRIAHEAARGKSS